MREHEYEIRAHYDNDKVIAHVWWDGKKVTSDDASFLSTLSEKSVRGLYIESGIPFLKALPSLYKNGYMSARKVKNDK